MTVADVVKSECVQLLATKLISTMRRFLYSTQLAILWFFAMKIGKMRGGDISVFKVITWISRFEKTRFYTKRQPYNHWGTHARPKASQQ